MIKGDTSNEEEMQHAAQQSSNKRGTVHVFNCANVDISERMENEFGVNFSAPAISRGIPISTLKYLMK